MSSVLTGLQVLMFLAWSYPLIAFAPYAWRKTSSPHDTLRAAVWVVSFAFAAFPLRWFIYGTRASTMPAGELAVWSALYVLGTLGAVFLTSATYGACRER